MSSKLVFGSFDTICITNWVVIIFFVAVFGVIVSVTSRGNLLTHLINSWLSTRVFTLITNSWHHDDSDSVVRKWVDYVIRWWRWVKKVHNLLTQIHITIELRENLKRLLQIKHSLFLQFFDDEKVMVAMINATMMMMIMAAQYAKVLFCGGDNNHHNRRQDLQ